MLDLKTKREQRLQRENQWLVLVTTNYLPNVTALTQVNPALLALSHDSVSKLYILYIWKNKAL